MEKRELLKAYQNKREDITKTLNNFKNLKEEDYYSEFLFCTLTPQSKAQKCWEAVQEIVSGDFEERNIKSILAKKTRFHNNKTKYIIKNKEIWPKIKEKLSESDVKQLRNYIADNVYGYGLKEAGHFLRNIGKSNNQIAILDRHILRNLVQLGVISSDKLKSQKDYHEIESKFLNYSNKIGIPIDHLDLLFWSNENGTIFK